MGDPLCHALQRGHRSLTPLMPYGCVAVVHLERRRVRHLRHLALRELEQVTAEPLPQGGVLGGAGFEPPQHDLQNSIVGHDGAAAVMPSIVRIDGPEDFERNIEQWWRCLRGHTAIDELCARDDLIDLLLVRHVPSPSAAQEDRDGF